MYFANTTWLMTGRLVTMAVTLVVGIYIARYLGPQQYGLLSYAVSFVALFSIFSTLGLDQIVVKELISSPNSTPSVLGTVFRLKLGGAVTVILLLSTILLVSGESPETKLLILIISTGLIFQSFSVIDFYFQSRVLSKYVVIAHVVQVLFSAILKLSLIALKANLIFFAIAILIDSLLVAIGLIYFYTHHNKKSIPAWNFDRTLAWELLRKSWPLALSGLVVTIYMKIDQVMLKELLNPEAVGRYAVAARISEIWYFIPGLIVQSLFPAIISLKSSKSEHYKRSLQQLHDFLSMAALIIAIPVCLFAESLIEFLYGSSFSDAGLILSIHIWAGLLVFPGNIRAHLIVLEDQQLIALVFRSIGAVLNIVLNFLLIPRYGAVGAAWATLASYIFPVLLVCPVNSLIRSTVAMTIKSYAFPIRLLLYRTSLYKTAR